MEADAAPLSERAEEADADADADAEVELTERDEAILLLSLAAGFRGRPKAQAWRGACEVPKKPSGGREMSLCCRGVLFC